MGGGENLLGVPTFLSGIVGMGIASHSERAHPLQPGEDVCGAGCGGIKLSKMDWDSGESSSNEASKKSKLWLPILTVGERGVCR